MAMKQIPLRLPEELLARINQARGDIPRERWIRRLIEEHLCVNVATEGGEEE